MSTSVNGLSRYSIKITRKEDLEISKSSRNVHDLESLYLSKVMSQTSDNSNFKFFKIKQSELENQKVQNIMLHKYREE